MSSSSSSTNLSTLLSRRDRWPFLAGLALGVGIATIVHTFSLSSASVGSGSPFSFAFETQPSMKAGYETLSIQLFTKKGKRPKILLFGDSLTQRAYDLDAYGWAAALANVYSRRADVINRGFSGYTSKWCALMLESLFPMDDPLWEIPILAIIFLGANDASLPSRQQHVPVSEYQANMRKIIKYFKRRGPSTQLLLLTPPPVDEERWEEHCLEKGRELDRKNEVTHLYVKGCQAVGAEFDVPVVDLWTLLGGRNQSVVSPHLIDGLHLSATGNGKPHPCFEFRRHDLTPVTYLPTYRGNAKVIDAVMGAIKEKLTGVQPKDLPMQAPEHFELESTTRHIRF